MNCVIVLDSLAKIECILRSGATQKCTFWEHTFWSVHLNNVLFLFIPLDL